MDLQLADQRFIVCGASGGFGLATARALLDEGATVLAVARRREPLDGMVADYPGRCEAVVADLTTNDGLHTVLTQLGDRALAGVFLNAGGPPVGTASDTTGEEWDAGYQLVFRWKAVLTQHLLPRLRQQGYGRVLFVESQGVKQPIPGLAQSNAMRLAVVGYAKTLAREVAHEGITVNVLAPGMHDTDAIVRLVQSRQDAWGLDEAATRAQLQEAIPVGRFGRTEEFARLAAFLLSPASGYITGQTISHDGGNIMGSFG